MPKFSVDLNYYAAQLLAARSDFTLEELINFALTNTYKDQSSSRLNV